MIRGYERRRREAWGHTLAIVNLWSKKKVGYDDLFAGDYEPPSPDEFWAHIEDWAKRDPTIAVPERKLTIPD